MSHLENTLFDRAIYKGALFELTINNDLRTKNSYYLKWNFKEDKYAKCYYLPITPTDLDCAYSIKNYCEYNGDVLECGYSEERRTFSLHLGENEELCRRYGIGDVYDRYIGSRGYECYNDLWIVVPEDEVLDVWEQRSPIKGFPFHGPEKVYVRKDGVWLR